MTYLKVLIILTLLASCDGPRPSYDREEQNARADSLSAAMVAWYDSIEFNSPENIRLREIDTSCDIWRRLRSYEEDYKGERMTFPRLRVAFVGDNQITLRPCGLLEFDKEIVLSGKSYTYEFERESGLQQWPKLKEDDHIRLVGVFTGVDREGVVNISATEVENFGYVNE